MDLHNAHEGDDYTEDWTCTMHMKVMITHEDWTCTMCMKVMIIHEDWTCTMHMKVMITLRTGLAECT